MTFCKPCMQEYTVEGIDVCLICDRETMTQEERMDSLKTKLEEFKQS